MVYQIVYDVGSLLKSEPAEMYHCGRPVEVIQKTIPMRFSGFGGYSGEFANSIVLWTNGILPPLPPAEYQRNLILISIPSDGVG